MLTYIEVSVSNDPFRGGVTLVSKAKKTSIDEVDSIKIYRKENNFSADLVLLDTIKVTSVSDLNFKRFDMTAVSGKEYVYVIDVMSADDMMPIEFQQFGVVKCKFDGLFVGDNNKQFLAGVNFKTEVKQNTQVEYVTTLNSKFPFRVSNSITNYSTGASEGLFLKFLEDKKRFIPDYDHSFSKSVIDFLTDGNSKIVKTHDGQIWYVSIDANPIPVYSDYTGMNAVSFNWTEIGDVPQFGMVIDE